MLAWERLSPEELNRRRAARLETTLRHAVSSAPFYRDRLGAADTLSLASFPVLSRELVHEHFKELMTDRLRAEYDGIRRRRHRYSWLEIGTGGSTGVPTKVIHDRDFRDFDRASRLYAMALCGFPFGTPYLRLWGSMKEINQIKASLGHRLVGWFARESLLNAFQMEAENMTQYLRTIEGSGTDHMMAYVDAAYQLALHARRFNLPAKPLTSVMACGGTVTEDVRRVIQDVFKTRVHSKYGSRDCGDMACECSEGGIHVFANWYVLEVVDEEGVPVPPGENGRVLVTVLGNRGFPMIRYEIGDVGALAVYACTCGSSFPLLDRIEGRSVEFLSSTGGGYVSPSYIIHLIGVVHNPGTLRRFQLVQETRERFCLKLQWKDGVAAEEMTPSVAAIVSDLKKVLGAEADVRVDRVPRIKETDSGKFLYTINRCPRD